MRGGRAPSLTMAPARDRRCVVISHRFGYHPERPSGSSRLAYDEAKVPCRAWSRGVARGVGRGHGSTGARPRRGPPRPPISPAALGPALDPTGAVTGARCGGSSPACNGPRGGCRPRAHAASRRRPHWSLYGGHARGPATRCIHRCGAEMRAARRGAPAAERLETQPGASCRSRLRQRILRRCCDV